MQNKTNVFILLFEWIPFCMISCICDSCRSVCSLSCCNTYRWISSLQITALSSITLFKTHSRTIGQSVPHWIEESRVLAGIQACGSVFRPHIYIHGNALHKHESCEQCNNQTKLGVQIFGSPPSPHEDCCNRCDYNTNGQQNVGNILFNAKSNTDSNTKHCPNSKNTNHSPGDEFFL